MARDGRSGGTRRRSHGSGGCISRRCPRRVTTPPQATGSAERVAAAPTARQTPHASMHAHAGCAHRQRALRQTQVGAARLGHPSPQDSARRWLLVLVRQRRCKLDWVALREELHHLRTPTEVLRTAATPGPVPVPPSIRASGVIEVESLLRLTSPVTRLYLVPQSPHVRAWPSSFPSPS